MKRGTPERGDRRWAGVFGARDHAGSAFAWRVSALYGALFLLAGAQLPFLPLWLAWRGLSAAEIGVAMALPLFARIVVTPLVGYAADRFGGHRRTLVVLTWTALAIFVVLRWADAFWAIVSLMLLLAIAWTPVMPLSEAVAMRGVRTRGLDYGRMRLWGSLSFIAMSLGGGLMIAHGGAGAAIVLMILGAAATVAAVHMLPTEVGGAATADRPPVPTVRSVAALAGAWPFLTFLLAAGSVQASHAVFYTFGTVHWRAQGLSAGWSGVLWSIGVVAEIVLFAASSAAVRTFGPVVLIMMGAFAGMLRWTAMAFDPPLAVLAVLQVMHALTFGATHLGAVHYIAANVPQQLAGTAQAAYASVNSGIFMGLSTLLAGRLYATAGAHAYLAMSLIAAVGFGGGLILLRSQSAARAGERSRP